MTEVGAALHPVVGTVGTIDNVKAVARQIDEGREAVAGLHTGIVLRSPGDEVAAVGSGKERRAVVHLEHQPPGAVVGPAERGVVHALLGPPCAVVAGAELPQMLPRAADVLHGNVQALACIGRIDKDGVGALLGQSGRTHDECSAESPKT